MVHRLTQVAAGVAITLIVAAPVAAQVSGDCTIVFNGVESGRIASLNSPLELDTNDVLIFSGTDAAGTRSAVVRLFIGPVAIESGTTTFATPQAEFTATIDLNDVSPYGVGLFRAEAETDGCSAGVWVRVSGRFPLATLTGLTAVGLAVGGATGQLGAISSRRRWARSAATLGGVATGAGVSLIGQQAGRLQISFISVGLIVAGCGLLGWILASLINPELREQRRSKRDSRRRPPEAAKTPRRSESGTAAPDRGGADEPDDGGTTRRLEPPIEDLDPEPKPVTIQSEPVAQAQPEPAQVVATRTPDPAPAVVREPPPPSGPYWCYVLAPTDVFDLRDHTRTIAILGPGTWYLAKRTVSGWAHVVAGEGIEGWVAESAIHRQS